MTQLLVTVEDAFDIKGRGLVLAPEISITTELSKVGRVSLISPDGSMTKTTAIFGVTFHSFSTIEARNSYKPGITCILKAITKAEVPINTEIWLD